MSVTSIVLTSSKEDHDEIAIGETIDYHVDMAGNFVPNDRVVIEVRRNEDYSVEMSKTIRPYLTGSGYDGEFVNTWNMKTSQGLELCDNISDGGYHLYSEYVQNPTVNDGPLRFRVVLITPWLLENFWLAGVDFKKFDNTALPSAVAMGCVIQAIGKVEEDLKIFFYPKVVRTQPEATEVRGVDYDVEADRITYIRKDHKGIGFISLPHYWITDVEFLKGYLANEAVFELPSQWIQVVKKRGSIQVIATSATHARLLGTLGISIVMGQWVEDNIPKFWDTKYTCGWNECNENFPKTWLSLIGYQAVLFAAPIISDALRPGIASMSLSMDGVSESEGTTASAIYSLLSARVEKYEKNYNKLLKSLIAKYRGYPFTVA